MASFFSAAFAFDWEAFKKTVEYSDKVAPKNTGNSNPASGYDWKGLDKTIRYNPGVKPPPKNASPPKNAPPPTVKYDLQVKMPTVGYDWEALLRTAGYDSKVKFDWSAFQATTNAAIFKRDVGCKQHLLIVADPLFEFDKSALTPAAEKFLQDLLPIIRAHGNRMLNIEGHTDAKGTDEYNQVLSEQRANAVRDWLTTSGIPRAYMTVSGFGKRRPVAPNTMANGADFPEGRQRNRRVEVVVDDCNPVNVEVKDEGVRKRLLIAGDLLFDFDKSELTPASEKTLAQLGSFLSVYSSRPITVEGHTDSVGNDEYNQALSERRAASVKDWLLNHKFVSDSITTVGYGKTKPVSPNSYTDGTDFPQGRAKNRRVELVIDTRENTSGAATVPTRDQMSTHIVSVFEKRYQRYTPLQLKQTANLLTAQMKLTDGHDQLLGVLLYRVQQLQLRVGHDGGSPNQWKPTTSTLAPASGSQSSSFSPASTAPSNLTSHGTPTGAGQASPSSQLPPSGTGPSSLSAAQTQGTNPPLTSPAAGDRTDGVNPGAAQSSNTTRNPDTGGIGGPNAAGGSSNAANPGVNTATRGANTATNGSNPGTGATTTSGDSGSASGGFNTAAGDNTSTAGGVATGSNQGPSDSTAPASASGAQSKTDSGSGHSSSALDNPAAGYDWGALDRTIEQSSGNNVFNTVGNALGDTLNNSAAGVSAGVASDWDSLQRYIGFYDWFYRDYLGGKIWDALDKTIDFSNTSKKTSEFCDWIKKKFGW